MKHSFFHFSAALLLLCIAIQADDMRPTRYGPFLQQGFSAEASPVGYRFLPPSGSYNFQAGWNEPLGILPQAIFHGTYLETQGNATLSPYEGDVGIVFNIKPIRFLDGGLGYNRLLFPYTLMGFRRPAGAGDNWLPSPNQWQTEEVLDSTQRSPIGADVFTFQGNFTIDLGRVQFSTGGSHSLWDVDAEDRDIVYEYRSGLLIQKHDQINSLYAQSLLNLEPYLWFWGFSIRGIEARDQYTWTVHTGLSENLVSGGFSGLRWGHNDNRKYHGLDGLIGFWTKQPQLVNQTWEKNLYISLQWMWNIQILNLAEN